MKKETKVTIIEHRKLSIKDSIVASIPCIIVFVMWFLLLIAGLNYFFYSEIERLTWMILMIMNIKFVPLPVTTYNVRNEYHKG